MEAVPHKEWTTSHTLEFNENSREGFFSTRLADASGGALAQKFCKVSFTVDDPTQRLFIQRLSDMSEEMLTGAEGN